MDFEKGFKGTLLLQKTDLGQHSANFVLASTRTRFYFRRPGLLEFLSFFLEIIIKSSVKSSSTNPSESQSFIRFQTFNEDLYSCSSCDWTNSTYLTHYLGNYKSCFRTSRLISTPAYQLH